MFIKKEIDNTINILPIFLYLVLYCLVNRFVPSSFNYSIWIYDVIFVIAVFILQLELIKVNFCNKKAQIIYLLLLIGILPILKYFWTLVLKIDNGKIDGEFIFGSLIFGPIIEELLFTGFLFNKLSRFFRDSYFIPALITASIFIAQHTQNYWYIAPIFIMSFIYTFLYYRTKNIVLSIVAHFYWNILGFYIISK